MLRGLRNQKPPLLPRQPPAVVNTPPLAPTRMELGYQEVPDIANPQAIAPAIPLSITAARPIVAAPMLPVQTPDIASMSRPGILSRLGQVISDPATSRALMAFGMNLIGSGDFGQALSAGREANDSYNERKLREQIAAQNAELANRRENREARRDEAMIGFEARKVGVLERAEDIKAFQAQALARYQEMQGRAALENAVSGRINAESLAKHRRDLIALGYSRIEADREIETIRQAAATERVRMAQAGIGGRWRPPEPSRGQRLSPAQARGILESVLTEKEIAELQKDPAAYAAALDAAAQGFTSSGMQGALAGALRRAPTIGSDAEYDSLPSGALFVTPDGRLMRKP